MDSIISVFAVCGFLLLLMCANEFLDIRNLNKQAVIEQQQDADLAVEVAGHCGGGR